MSASAHLGHGWQKSVKVLLKHLARQPGQVLSQLAAHTPMQLCKAGTPSVPKPAHLLVSLVLGVNINFHVPFLVNPASRQDAENLQARNTV